VNQANLFDSTTDPTAQEERHNEVMKWLLGDVFTEPPSFLPPSNKEPEKLAKRG
jgi:hypothetical protein